MKKHARILMALLSLSLAGALGWMYHRQAHAPALSELVKPRVAYGYRWTFSLITDGSNSFNALFGPNPAGPTSSPASQQIYHTELRGTILKNILAMDKDGMRVLFSFESLEASVMVNGNRNDFLARRIVKAQGQTFLAIFNAQGRLTSLQTSAPDDVDPEGLAAIIYRLQYPRLLEPDGQMITETDENGVYEVRAHYDRTHAILRKTEQRYQATGDSPFSVEASYDAQIAMDGEGARKIDGQQVLSFRTQNRQFSEVKNRWSLERTHVLPLGSAQLAVVQKQAQAGQRQQLVLNQNSEQERWERLQEESRLPEILARIQEPDFGSSENRVGKTLAQLVAHIRLNPVVIPEVIRVVETADFNSPAFIYSLGALIRAGTPEVQGMLAALLRNGFHDEPKRLFRLITHIHDLKAPTHELVREVQLIASSGHGWIAESALLAAGSLSGRLSEQNDPLGQEILNDFAHRWNMASSVDDKVRILHSFGNSGSKEALPVIRQGLTAAESYLTRKAAAEALHRIDDHLAQVLLIDTYLNDPHAEVKLAALTAMQGQKLETSLVLTLIQELMQAKDSESLTIRLMQTLWPYRVREPLIVQVVSQLASRGADLGREAQMLLESAKETSQRL